MSDPICTCGHPRSYHELDSCKPPDEPGSGHEACDCDGFIEKQPTRPPCVCGHSFASHDPSGEDGIFCTMGENKLAVCSCKGYTPAPTEEQQAAHQAAMDRAIQGMYAAACIVGQVGQLRPELLPRLMVCATVHSLERLITIYRQKDQNPMFPPQERQALLARIMGDCDDATEAMTEALQSIGELRAMIMTPESKLVS